MLRSIKLTVITLFISVLFQPQMSVAEDKMPTAPAKENLLLGEIKLLGDGAAWSWVKLDTKKVPMAIGITLTETALSGLPENPPSKEMYGWEYPLALPKQVEITPITHIGLDWNPQGHVPPGVYDVPHFDIHFYLLTPQERDKITAKGDDLAKCLKKPAAEFIPVGYILPPGTEYPHMGVHWVDSSAPEFNKQPFTMTFIYGSYDGQVAFFEPMVSRAFLESKPDITQNIKLPTAYQKHGYYPTAYSVKYDKLRKEYTVSLEGLTYR